VSKHIWLSVRHHGHQLDPRNSASGRMVDFIKTPATYWVEVEKLTGKKDVHRHRLKPAPTIKWAAA